MDQSYHDQLAAGVEKRFRDLEMSIMDDIIRRIRKAGTITDSADWQIQRLIILGNSTQDIEDLIRKAVDGNEEEVRRLYAEVIEREYTRDRSLYEQIGKEFIPYEQTRAPAADRRPGAAVQRGALQHHQEHRLHAGQRPRRESLHAPG